MIPFLLLGAGLFTTQVPKTMAAVSVRSCSIGTSIGLVHVSGYNATLRFKIEQLERVTSHELDGSSWHAFENCS